MSSILYTPSSIEALPLGNSHWDVSRLSLGYIMSLKLLKQTIVGLSAYLEDEQPPQARRAATSEDSSSSTEPHPKAKGTGLSTRKYGRLRLQRQRILAAQRGHEKATKQCQSISLSSSSDRVADPVLPSALSK
jgi:hypothetical protein